MRRSLSKPTLDVHEGECIVSIINNNNNNGIKEPNHGYQNCNTNHILIFGGYSKMRESFNTQVIIKAKTILEHNDTRYERSCMAY